MGRRWQLRDKESFINYVKIELQLLAKEWKIILPCVIMQYVHAIFHNLAYYIQGHYLSTEQRFTLYDLGYELMPELTGTAASLSDILVFAAIFGPAILLVLTIPLFKQEPGRPRYLVIVLKRCLLQLSICLIFRCISFLVTALPSPADHCELKFDDTCLAANPNDPVPCVIPNPKFNPPSVSEWFTRLDSLNGCGDLMFSSHTIYTVSLILTVWKFWPNKYGITIMVCVQIAIAFLIVASRKHYTLDVFSALYIVPLFWLTFEAYHKDINHKDSEVTVKTIYDFYGVDVSSDANDGSVALDTRDVVPSPAAPLNSVQVAMTEDESLSGDRSESDANFQRKNSL
ncbi:Phosphatidylinositol:ceramide inositolphosphotransferase 2 [Phytophthora citrophthora]|uniref:Phosphatidylinositol:ceramide inositolphosphotransferase 2 n=1 Tax=Phytophthora citrophthora TaxID=4793 RepID=A0AAD9GZW6_9STRA|nr:Phosphatidylinositol:ceramide inositolphosphotransferase 2 [Phytophthora citrophthora]